VGVPIVEEWQENKGQHDQDSEALSKTDAGFLSGASVSDPPMRSTLRANIGFRRKFTSAEDYGTP
jgi:hypothetical protein